MLMTAIQARTLEVNQLFGSRGQHSEPSAEDSERLACALRCSQAPSSLSLDGCALGYCLVIAESLRQGCALRDLEFGGLSRKGWLAVASALKEASGLCSVTFNISRASVGEETGIALATALEQNTSLRSFTLHARGADIGDETGAAFAKALSRNSTLQSFSLFAAQTQIGSETCLAMALTLEHHSSLQSFAIDIGIADDAGIALAKALKHSVTLISFTLATESSGTRISDATGLAFAEALRHNTNLRSFTLCAERTSAGNLTGVAMADALKQNTVLRDFTLEVGETRNTDLMVSSLADALHKNTRLEAFVARTGPRSLSLGSLSLEASVLLQEALVANVTLQRFELWPSDLMPEAWLQRNTSLLTQWRALAQLARCSHDSGFWSLAETAFRGAVFEYFLPPSALARPKWLSAGGWVTAGSTSARAEWSYL